MNTPFSPDLFLTFANRLADASAAVLNAAYRSPIPTEIKGDHSPVTQADREAERVMRALIDEHFPDHGIIGEEHGIHQPDAEWLWVLDPIDGTRNFISGTPLFTTLIALCHRQQPYWGIINQPVTGERWIGGRDLPTRLNGQLVGPRQNTALPQSILTTTAPECLTEGGWKQFQRLSAACAVTTYGKDAYGYGLLASGFVDIVMEEGLKPYDFAAVLAVLEGAGACVTDWQGRPLNLQSNGQVLAAATAELHREALDEVMGNRL